jgi:hypothetical protein
MEHITKLHSLELRKHLGKRNNDWEKDRTWCFNRSNHNNQIQRKHMNGSVSFYTITRKTTQTEQRYNLTHTSTQNQDHTQPITPCEILRNHIVITNSTTTYNIFSRPPEKISPKTTKLPPTNNPAVLARPVGQFTYIGIHTQHTYESQNFSWVIRHEAQQELIKGPVQLLHSRKCAATRGGLISLLQALQHIQKSAPTSHQHTKRTVTIVCCTERKLAIQLQRYQSSSSYGRMKIQSEQELLIELAATTNNFQHIKFKHFTKKVNANTTGRTILNSCIEHVKQSTQTNPTQLPQNGKASLWHMNEEVSDQIDDTVRHAAGTAELRTYMQMKYKWTDQTVDESMVCPQPST